MKQRALVTIGGGYSDVIMATPVIAALNSMDYIVDALVESARYEAATLLSGWDALDTIYLTRQSLLQRERFRGYAAVVRTIHHHGSDIGLGPEYKPESCVLKSAHPVDLNISALRGLGWKGITPACHTEYDTPFWPLPEAFFAVAHGAARGSTRRAYRKNWPYWREFCLMLHQRSGLEIVLLGTEEDEERWMRDPGLPWLHNLCGQTSIRGAAGVIVQAAGLYAVDNGLAHLGAALRRPVTAVFGATDETLNAPRGENVRVVTGNLACRPCEFSPDWEECLEAHCLTMLTPEQVFVPLNREGREGREERQRQLSA